MTVVDNIRSFTVLGAPGTGKTSLAEAMMFRAKAIGQPEGGKILDTDPEEIKRRTTLFAKLQTLSWNGMEVSFADTPGLTDFIGAAVAPLAVLDAAVIVVDSINGVDVATRKLYELAVQYKKPVIVFINKLDRENVDFAKAVDSVRKSLTKRAHPFTLPVGIGPSFSGMVDLVEAQAFTFGNKVDKQDIPADMVEAVEEARQHLLEEIAETDEVLFEKVASGEQLNLADVGPQLLRAVSTGELVPILCGSVIPPRGPSLLLDAICRLIPPSSQRPAPKATQNGKDVTIAVGPDEPAVAKVFKVSSDPGVGEQFFIKVVSGTIRAGDDMANARCQERERIGHMTQLCGKEKKEITEVTVGQIAAIPKLKHTLVGDTLTATNRVVDLEPIVFPSPVHSITVLPQTRKDQDKLGVALGKLIQTDPTVHTHMDAEFNEIVLSGMGEVHLDSVATRLRDKFGVNITLGLPHVAYRETLAKKVKAQGRHKKQTGGHGQFGDVWISMEPTAIGSGFEFADEIKGGVVPSKFIPSVETGVRDSMKRGGLAGFPVVDIKVALFDGSYHSVDSSDVAFQLAGSIAFKKCLELSGTVILEPIMRMQITILGEYVGAITSDLNSRRGRILGMDAAGDLQIVNAEVPQAEVFRYSTDLRSMTQGAGTFSMEFARYEPVPSQIAATLKEQAEARRKEAAPPSP